MKFKYILILTASSLATVSCGKKFLDRKPIATTVDQNFYQNDAQLLSGVNAVYDPLNWYQAEVKSSSTPIFEFIWGDICSDDALGGGDKNGDARYGRLGNFDVTPTTPQLQAVWKNQYIGIRRANIIIEKAPVAPLATEAIKARVAGEAKFLRAYYHFYLYRMFGPVPYITKQLQDGEFEQARPSRADFFTKLIQDLKDAKDVLPYKYSGRDLGRVTKGAAAGYLARVYLFMGNSSELTANWGGVLEETEGIIKDTLLSGYNLQTKYENIHSLSTEYGSESLFEIGATSNGPVATNRDNEGTYFDKITGIRGQLALQGYGLIAPSQDLYNEFVRDSTYWATKQGLNKMDPRRKATIAAPGDTVFGETIKLLSGAGFDGSESAKYYRRKYMINQSLPEQTQGPTNLRLLRMADVYLMAAEAAYHTGDRTKALKYVNRVRARVNMPLLEDANPDFAGSKFLDAILKERRMELALEGQRFFDIVRQGNAGKIFTELAKNFPGEEGSAFVAGKNEVFPIPQSEIDLSGGKISQNKNY